MTKKLSICIVALAILAIPCFVMAAGNMILGKVTNGENALVGANVIVLNNYQGSSTDFQGKYTIVNVADGTYTIQVSYMGYAPITKEIEVRGEDLQLNFEMEEDVIYGEAIKIMANRAVERKTPVAFTDIKKEDLEARLGSQDIPLVLNTTPSVYSTVQGGGAGDARFNMRGFSQRNISVMINGIPQNDMENGWVYWSNWDGLADAASSIQVQRGLSATNLATPSIGGTMNVITDPTRQKAGLTVKQEKGSWNFSKQTVVFNTGLINNKFAFNGAVVKKTGDGFATGTWTDAYAYYFGGAWNISSNNRLELYAMGAPQRHGQRLYAQNIGAWSESYARSLDDYDPEAFTKYKESGISFNQNVAPVSPAYRGKQQYWNSTSDRFSSTFINSRENFFHKPVVNMNWFTKLSEKLNVYSTLYYSGGNGGGTGTYGPVYAQDATGNVGDDDHKYYYGPAPWTWNWDATIAMNQGPAGTYYVNKSSREKEDGQSIGILRNSRNNQWTLGLISRANYKVSESVKTAFGIDWRKAKIDHFREVRDLLGGEYYIDKSSDFWGDNGARRYLGDKIAYDFTNDVDWLGVYGQAEYSKGKVTTYGTVGISAIKYGHVNHFMDDGTGNELALTADWITAFQVKGGASYRVNEKLGVFANAGYVQKVPIFDEVIDDYTGTKNNDYEQSLFLSGELGAGYNPISNLSIKADVYMTQWQNRTEKYFDYQLESGDEVNLFMHDVDQQHMGFEMELGYQPVSAARLDASFSVGDWKYLDDVSGTAKEVGSKNQYSYNIYISDLKVGDQPQTSLALMATVYPFKGFFGQLVLKHYRDHYAKFNPFDRQNPSDRVQPWSVPDYSVIDFHASYNLPVSVKGADIQLFVHAFNILDELYIQDAKDNSPYNAWDRDHDADDAEVYFGLPRRINAGISVHIH